MEINAQRYAQLLADAAFLRQIKDALENSRSDTETIAACWAIMHDADSIRASIGGLK